MAIIAQNDLFGWEEIDELGDLQRLVLALKSLPDEPLMLALERGRGRGRDDYPIRAVWNSMVAGIVLEHSSIQSLRRELQRNAQLRQVCGFDVTRGEDAVPPAHAYTRLLKNLFKHAEQIDAMFDTLVDELRDALPQLGQNLAIDSKAIRTHARRPAQDAREKHADGRRDTDADTGVKTYKGRREDGTLWEKTRSWFGYKLHLIVDADYELPLAYEVTRASASDITVAHAMIDDLEESRPEQLETCEHFMGDKAYDDSKLHVRLWRDSQIKPIIPLRDLWQDGEETKLVSGTRNVVHNAQGDVLCCCPQTGRQRAMAFGGFEKDRNALKYRCPAIYHGVTCEGKQKCPVNNCVRIKLAEDPRIFGPVARTTYQWPHLYKKRTAVERVNSRLDVSFGFERHFIRGQAKMRLRCGLALIVMLAMAAGRIKEKRSDLIRSLVSTAA